MSEKRNFIFKPLDNFHLHFLCVSLFVFIPFDICLFIAPFEVSLLITVLLMNFIPILVYTFIRFFYNIRYVVDDAYVIKYRKNKVVLKIRRDDLDEIYIQKGGMKFFGQFFISIIFNTGFSKPFCTTMSFTFRNYDVIAAYNNVEIPRPSIKDDSSMFEYVEILSYRRCMRLCKYLNIEPIVKK